MVQSSELAHLLQYVAHELTRIEKVNEAQNVVFRNISLSAASTSSNEAKNTDGWDIYRSDNVVIDQGTINNGDDCVSFKPSESSRDMKVEDAKVDSGLTDSTNILVSNLACNGSQYVLQRSRCGL